MPLQVSGDPHRVRQCLMNLVSNAIKFTAAGEIVLRLSLLDRTADRCRLRFEVRDTGIGIAQSALGTLFAAFVQAETSTTRRFGGTGLGLSIVKKLVELMGGEIRVTSELGQGSVFAFELPFAIEAAPTQLLARDQTPARGLLDGCRLLIVDDNQTQRQVLAARLAQHGGHVQLAASAATALELLEQAGAEGRAYDMALIDRQMPTMDGLQLARTIRSSATLTGTRLIMLTSLGRDRDQQLQELGLDVLAKPVRNGELTECLAQALLRPPSPVVATPRATIALSTQGPAPATLRVLLVEDNVVNQKVAKKFLERLGCEVQIAADGAAGVREWQAASFDLVLMDVQMPVMDGYQATTEVRRLESGSGRHTPIVALTANALPDQLQRCLQSGMDDHLTKPIDAARLQQIIDRYRPAATDRSQPVLSIADETSQDAATG